MKKISVLTIFIGIGCWYVAAGLIHNDIILPYPQQVLMQMVQDLQHPNFLKILFATVQKTYTAFFYALLLGFGAALLAGYVKMVEIILQPLVLLFKTVPNITYMFLLLLWLPSETAVYYVIFFIIIPVIYTTVLGGMKELDNDLQDVLRLYPETWFFVLRHVYIPQVYPYLKSAIFATLSLGMKVGVMAEVLGQVRYGIGKEMYLSKLNLQMVGVFSWTIWMILLVAATEWGVKAIFRWLEQRDSRIS